MAWNGRRASKAAAGVGRTLCILTASAAIRDQKQGRIHRDLCQSGEVKRTEGEVANGAWTL